MKNNSSRNYVRYIKMGFNRANNNCLHFALFFTALTFLKLFLKSSKKTKWIQRKHCDISLKVSELPCRRFVLSECFLIICYSNFPNDQEDILDPQKTPCFPQKSWVKLKVTTQTSQMKPQIKPQIPKGTELSNSINFCICLVVLSTWRLDLLLFILHY